MILLEKFEPFHLFISVFCLLASVLWIWAFLDIIRLSKNSHEAPAPWFLIILLFPVIGSIIFFQVGRPRMKRATRSSKFSS